MTEHYNLPILFTEEERQRYAAWGNQKRKDVTALWHNCRHH